MVTSESWIVETVKARNEGVSVISYRLSVVRRLVVRVNS